MDKILILLQAGKFLTYKDGLASGLKTKKSFEMAIYRLRRKGYQIETLDEYGETVYYLKNG